MDVPLTDPLLPFPTELEQRTFKLSRESGLITWFRSSKCPICAKEMPKQYEACSSTCHAKLVEQRAGTMSEIAWNINLEALQSGKVRIETKEGAVRTGKITRIETFKTELPGGRTVETPHSVIVDGDAADAIDWHIIRAITKAP